MCKYCEYSGNVKFGANMLDDSYSEGEGYSITICDVFKNPQRKFICIEDEDGESAAALLILIFAPSVVGSCNRPIE